MHLNVETFSTVIWYFVGNSMQAPCRYIRCKICWLGCLDQIHVSRRSECHLRTSNKFFLNGRVPGGGGPYKDKKGRYSSKNKFLSKFLIIYKMIKKLYKSRDIFRYSLSLHGTVWRAMVVFNFVIITILMERKYKFLVKLLFCKTELYFIHFT